METVSVAGAKNLVGGVEKDKRNFWLIFQQWPAVFELGTSEPADSSQTERGVTLQIYSKKFFCGLSYPPHTLLYSPRITDDSESL